RRGKGNPSMITLVTDDSPIVPETLKSLHYFLGPRTLYAASGARPLLTNNDSNLERVFGSGWTNSPRYVKDAFHREIVNGEHCTNSSGVGTKACLDYQFDAVPPGGSV